MKKKFKFEVSSKIDRSCIFYKTDEIEMETPAFHESSNLLASGKYQYGVNGKDTAFATLTIKHKNHLGVRKSLRKHFKGTNAGQRARAWLNMMLNNLPDYIDKERD